MKRLLPVVLLLAACSSEIPTPVPTAAPTPLPSGVVAIEIYVHCGIDWPRIEFEGEVYRFQARNAMESSNPPVGWGNVETVMLRRIDDEVWATGPDGSLWTLVPVAEWDEESDMCI